MTGDHAVSRRFSRRSAPLVLAAMAAILGACGVNHDAPARHDSAAPDSIRLAHFEAELAAAAMRRDSASIAQMLADDWTITLADGRRSDKVRALAKWTAPRAAGIARDTSVVDSVVVRLLGPDAAVLTAAITDIDVRVTGADTTRTRVTDVVVRRADRWQAIVSHESVRPSRP